MNKKGSLLYNIIVIVLLIFAGLLVVFSFWYTKESNSYKEPVKMSVSFDNLDKFKQGQEVVIYEEDGKGKNPQYSIIIKDVEVKPVNRFKKEVGKGDLKYVYYTLDIKNLKPDDRRILPDTVGYVTDKKVKYVSYIDEKESNAKEMTEMLAPGETKTMTFFIKTDEDVDNLMMFLGTKADMDNKLILFSDKEDIEEE